MSLSLDYIGKFVIMLVALAVAIALIVDLKGDVDIDWPPGGDEPQMEILNIEGTSDEKAQKIANAIQLCQGKADTNPYEDTGCYVVRSTDQDLSLPATEIGSHLPTEIRSQTTFQSDTYTGETVIIRYNAGEQRIIVRN